MDPLQPNTIQTPASPDATPATVATAPVAAPAPAPTPVPVEPEVVRLARQQERDRMHNRLREQGEAASAAQARARQLEEENSRLRAGGLRSDPVGTPASYTPDPAIAEMRNQFQSMQTALQQLAQLQVQQAAQAEQARIAAANEQVRQAVIAQYRVPQPLQYRVTGDSVDAIYEAAARATAEAEALRAMYSAPQVVSPQPAYVAVPTMQAYQPQGQPFFTPTAPAPAPAGPASFVPSFDQLRGLTAEESVRNGSFAKARDAIHNALRNGGAAPAGSQFPMRPMAAPQPAYQPQQAYVNPYQGSAPAPTTQYAPVPGTGGQVMQPQGLFSAPAMNPQAPVDARFMQQQQPTQMSPADAVAHARAMAAASVVNGLSNPAATMQKLEVRGGTISNHHEYQPRAGTPPVTMQALVQGTAQPAIGNA